MDRTKRTVLAINAGVWLAALTSAAFAAVASTRPARFPAPASSPDLQTEIECSPAAPSPSVTQPLVYMPDDSIVAARLAPSQP
jgi:hypothetical protein